MPTQVETGNIKPRIQFTADGEQKEFQFFFTIYEPENVKVYIEDVLQISGYSLSLNEEVPGGIVVFAEPPAAGKLITVYRDLELKRTTDFKEGVPQFQSQCGIRLSAFLFGAAGRFNRAYRHFSSVCSHQFKY